MTELEKERNREREREWNKRHPTPSHKLTRPSSSLSLRSYHQNDMTDPSPRARTQSQVSPFGAKLTPPGRDMNFGRRHSSYGTPPVPPSPSASIDSLDDWKERQKDMDDELQHERERNWGSPHPKWPSRERRTSVTSVTSASPSPSPSPHSDMRIRAGSLRERTPPTSQTLRSKTSITSLGAPPSPSPQSKSLSPRPAASFARPTKSSMSRAAEPPSQVQSPGSPSATRPTRTSINRTHTSPHSGSNSSEASGSSSQIGKYIQSPPVSPSPSPRRDAKAETERPVTPGVSSRFGWSFPSRSPTPVIPEDEPPTEHSRRFSSPLPGGRYTRLDHTGRVSHIPVRASPSPSRPSHRRATTELNEAFGSIPPPTIIVQELPEANGEVSILDSNLLNGMYTFLNCIPMISRTTFQLKTMVQR
jgi:serine/arginine repetitive matrix protein 2